MREKNTATLAVIDMQVAFAEPDSDWFIPRYKEVEAQVTQLVDAFEDSVVWTKFVRDPEEQGAWADYYDRWASFRVDKDSEQWDITLETRPEHATISLPTFSKWGSELADIAPLESRLVICGVATDCCVLSTALEAIDAGRSVTIVTDACGAVSDEAQKQTLDLLSLLSPMITLMTTAELLKSL